MILIAALFLDKPLIFMYLTKWKQNREMKNAKLPAIKVPDRNIIRRIHFDLFD